MVKEALPRCRADGRRVPIPGDDLVAGDAAVTSEALLVGVTRRDGAKRVAGVVRASLDLATISVLDLGIVLADDPPPSPRVGGGRVFVASYARAAAKATADGGAGRPSAASRVLEIARVDGASIVSEGTVVQQADESLAYDVAWPDGQPAAPLVAWDEDAPLRAGALLSERGVVKVQVLGAGAKARVVSPETTDAEAPRLFARRGGYWLAWLARRAEPGEDAGASGAVEAPAERRAYRWVEVVALDAKGELSSNVRRVSPVKGRAASFELGAAGADGQIVILVRDEAEHAEGAGEHIVVYAVDAEKIAGADLLDGGVGHALAEVLVHGGDASQPRWLAFADTQEHAHLAPLGPVLRLAGPATAEPSLDGARAVASASPDLVYAIGSAGWQDAAGAGATLSRFVCR